MSLRTSLVTIANSLNLQRPHWKAVLSTGKEVSELGMTFDFSRGGLRSIDWSLDLCSSANPDILKIKELWLMFPSVLPTLTKIARDTPDHIVEPWNAQSIMLPITEPGCAFQLKIKTLDGLGANTETFECQIIGTVTDKENGDCLCYIWDRVMGLIEYRTSVYDFGTWREGIAPLHDLSHAVVGLRLG
jgi:hypothetical protein